MTSVEEIHDDYRICLCLNGAKRKIVSLKSTDTLEDVLNMAIDSFGKENIQLRSGFPPRVISISSEKATSVLGKNERVNVMEINASIASSNHWLVKRDGILHPSRDDEPVQKRQRIKAAPAEEESGEWPCELCSLLNAAETTSCDACGAIRACCEEPRDGMDVVGMDVTTDNDWLSRNDHYTPRSAGKSLRKSRQSAASSSKEIEQWPCRRCTLMNATDADSCQVCGATRDDTDDQLVAIHLNESHNSSPQYAPSSPPVGAVSLDFQSRGEAPRLPEEINIVSFNVAGFKPSCAAPAGWDPIPAFRTEILKYKPHVVSLQEVPFHQHDFLPGYECVGSCQSHCENVVLMVLKEWAPHVVCVSGIHAPTVLARMAFSNNQTVTFGSCHFAPFGEGAATRLDQIKTTLYHANIDNEESNLILAGDFNMRAKEDDIFESFGIRDAWKEAGSDETEKFTWDSVDRTPRNAPEGFGPHNRFHGSDSYAFVCRFDRVYLAGTNVSVEKFQLIANQPLTNPFHYLSDHYGMRSTLRIQY